MIKRKKEPNFNFIVTPDFKEKEIKKVVKLAEKGNMNAKIDIVLHNQAVIHHRLKLLMKTK